jgi:hypothetical protein
LPSRTPEAAELVRYLNDNAGRMQSLQCNDVSINVKDGSLRPIPGLSGIMSCQKPQNLRLQARVMGTPAVDMGSNNDEFWFWVSQNDPPALMHCSYQDLARGNVNLPFPFSPDWILEALGMKEYNPNGNYQVRVTEKTVELSEQTTSLQGQPVTKVTVFDRASVSTSRPQVRAHRLLDTKGTVIYSADILKTQSDTVTGVVVPYQVSLAWPVQKLQMSMKLDEVRVNSIDASRAQVLFSRPQMPHVQSIDLARLQQPARPTGYVQRVSGTYP